MPIMQKVAVHPMSTMKDKKESKDGPKVKDGAQISEPDIQEVVIGMGMESVGGGGGGGGGGDMGDDMVGDRCDSQMSSISERLDICRICHCEGEEGNRLKSPCLCLGSLRYVHLRCLQKWIKSSEKMSCELCRFEYIMTTKTKPFREWEKLDMSTAERRKIICSVSFHVIAITCVIWSLYVLIDRTAEEVASGNLDWPFWTKLIVVAIGFIGGLVFMYVQCKMYVQLVLRWRSYNKVLHIEDVPETEEFRINALAKIKTRMEESGGVGGVTNSVAMQEIESF